jgi:hypothetical protein
VGRRRHGLQLGLGGPELPARPFQTALGASQATSQPLPSSSWCANQPSKLLMVRNAFLPRHSTS